jgi:hypothetical protein
MGKGKTILFTKDIVDALTRLALFSININPDYSIREHVSWVIMSIENLDGLLSRTNLNLNRVPKIVNCPKHGWVLSIKRSGSNKCLKCHRNRTVYRKKVTNQKLQNPLKTQEND